MAFNQKKKPSPSNKKKLPAVSNEPVRKYKKGGRMKREKKTVITQSSRAGARRRVLDGGRKIKHTNRSDSGPRNSCLGEGKEKEGFPRICQDYEGGTYLDIIGPGKPNGEGICQAGQEKRNAKGRRGRGRRGAQRLRNI